MRKKSVAKYRGKKWNWMQVRRNWKLYLLVALPLAWLIIFRYLPMAGVAMAFEDYSLRKGIFGSNFVGLKYFRMIFNTPNFKGYFWNTIVISFYTLAVFPIPIVLAIALNECQFVKVKKFIQTITFAPYFVSVVVLVSMMSLIFGTHAGLLNNFLGMFGLKGVDIIGKSSSFRYMYVLSGVWQSAGYNAILYIAALTSIDPALREAATIDGASRWQQIIHVDIPGIMPTVIITFILAVGNLMNVGFDKAYLMQTSSNLAVSEIIPTMVYKVGLQSAQFSYGAAVGLFNSLINFVLIVITNQICRKLGDTSLW